MSLTNKQIAISYAKARFPDDEVKGMQFADDCLRALNDKSGKRGRGIRGLDPVVAFALGAQYARNS